MRKLAFGCAGIMVFMALVLVVLVSLDSSPDDSGPSGQEAAGEEGSGPTVAETMREWTARNWTEQNCPDCLDWQLDGVEAWEDRASDGLRVTLAEPHSASLEDQARIHCLRVLDAVEEAGVTDQVRTVSMRSTDGQHLATCSP